MNNHIVRELKSLKRMSKAGRKKYLKTCSKESVIRICECVKNLLNGNVPLNSSHLKKLSRHRQSLRKLAAQGTSLKIRKQVLQRGGFLGTLLPILLPAVTSLLGGLFNKGN
jgi:hypothetical protein